VFVSAVDGRHVCFIVTLACGRREVVESLEVVAAEFEFVSGGAEGNHSDTYRRRRYIRTSPLQVMQLPLAPFVEATSTSDG
jgi:hypothetical protein